MKKNLLTIGLLAATLSVSGQDVLTYVGDGATMTIKDQALVYSGGGWQNAGSGNVSNLGDIMVVANATTNKFDIASTSNFNLAYQDTSIYGQLYIKGIPQGNISGKVNKDYKADNNNGFASAGTGAASSFNTGYQQMSLPFINYTNGDLQSNLGGSWLNLTSYTLNYTGRFNVASAFKWNNARARFDQLLGSGNPSGTRPTEYYAIPRRSQSADGLSFTIQWTPSADLKTFIGTPSSDETANSTVSLVGAADGIDYGTNGNNKNYYYERYNTYLNDPFRIGGGINTTWETDYGKNLYQFGNPFLTNLDLYSLYNSTIVGATGDVGIPNLVGVAYYEGSSNTYQNGYGTITATSRKAIVGADGKFQSGDVAFTWIKPMTAFMVKISGTSTSLNLNNMRRFANSSRTTGSYSVSAGKSTNSVSPDSVKQVAVVLYNSTNDEISRTYYAVSTGAGTGFSNDNNFQAIEDNTNLYTSEELTSGGADAGQTYKLYINAANEVNFAGKEIPMTVGYTQPAQVKFELYEAGVRVANGGNLSNGKSFYIKKDNVITQIVDGNSYAITAGNYGLYYEQPQSVLGTNNVSMNETIIVKKDSNWIVRFGSNWKSATVEVYSAAGQLLNARKKISTTNDYNIPLAEQANGLYLVKATSEKGEVVIKKIIK